MQPKPSLVRDHGPQRVTVLDRTDLSSGYFRLTRWQLTHERYDGSDSRPLSREVLHSGPAVALLPYDRASDTVLLIEQFRVPAYTAGLPPWQIEIVAGRIDPEEKAEVAARREATEEAGLSLRTIHPIGSMLASPGALDELVHLFVGAAELDKAGGVHGLASEDEDIRTMVVPAAQAIQWLDEGRILNAPTQLALHWLARNHDRLRAGLLDEPA